MGWGVGNPKIQDDVLRDAGGSLNLVGLSRVIRGGGDNGSPLRRFPTRSLGLTNFLPAFGIGLFLAVGGCVMAKDDAKGT